MSIMTGYFARPSYKGMKGIFTKVHIVKDGKPMCGYRPHPTMKFQFCAHDIQWDYLECKTCKDTAGRMNNEIIRQRIR